VNEAGNPADWADLLDPMVPEILRLVVDTWVSMPAPAADEKEDNITGALCRALRQNRAARELPFQIHTQQVELDPNPGEDMGRLDIVFNILVPREDIYFCLEGKRLNVVKDGVTRAYASEYVSLGMMRFVTGQYSRAVRHGGMIGYVLDGKIKRAIKNVETNIQSQCSALRMTPPGTLLTSALMNDDGRARETHHRRDHDPNKFRIHHLFMSAS
jgi:hypothetical protein